jgi:hypothetical protein
VRDDSGEQIDAATPGLVSTFIVTTQNVGMPMTRAKKKKNTAGPDPADTMSSGRSLRIMRHAVIKLTGTPNGRRSDASRIQNTR